MLDLKLTDMRFMYLTELRSREMRAAAGRLGRPCRQRRPFSLGNNRNKYGRNRTTKITG